jgi:hypothetical protein
MSPQECGYLNYTSPQNANSGDTYSVWKCWPYHATHFTGQIDAGIAIGSVLLLLALILFAVGVDTGKIRFASPFSPLVRMAERRQVYRQRVKLIRAGMDPEYLQHLEEAEARSLR